METLLVADSTPKQIPHFLAALVSSFLEENEFDNTCSDEALCSDLLAILLYELMIESGFVPLHATNISFKDDEKKSKKNYNLKMIKVKSYESMPRKWRSRESSVYSLTFVLIPFVGEYQCHLLGIRTGEYLITNVIVDSNAQGVLIKDRAMCFKTTDYVVDPRAQETTKKFQNLRELSIKFKDGIASPIRCAILTNEGLLNPSLTGLPEEVKMKLLKCLPVRDLLNLSKTCTSMNVLCNDPGLWKFLLERDFHYCAENNPWLIQNNWKQHFKSRYRTTFKQKERERLQEENGQFDLPFNISLEDVVPSATN